MYAWTCTCGDGAASAAGTWEDAQRAGEIHACRAGRMREAHVVLVRASDAMA